VGNLGAHELRGDLISTDRITRVVAPQFLNEHGCIHRIVHKIDPVSCSRERDIEQATLFCQGVCLRRWQQPRQDRICRLLTWEPMLPAIQAQYHDVIGFFALGRVYRHKINTQRRILQFEATLLGRRSPLIYREVVPSQDEHTGHSVRAVAGAACNRLQRHIEPIFVAHCTDQRYRRLINDRCRLDGLSNLRRVPPECPAERRRSCRPKAAAKVARKGNVASCEPVD